MMVFNSRKKYAIAISNVVAYSVLLSVLFPPVSYAQDSSFRVEFVSKTSSSEITSEDSDSSSSSSDSSDSSDSSSDEDDDSESLRPFDEDGNFIPAPVNPYPSIYELERESGASVDDIGIAPPVNPYPNTSNGDNSLGGYNPDKVYKGTKTKTKKKKTTKKKSHSSKKHKTSKTSTHRKKDRS